MSDLITESNKAQQSLYIEFMESIAESSKIRGWGKEYAIDDESKLKLLSFKPGGMTSLHYFPSCTKNLKVLSGSFIIEYPNSLSTAMMGIEHNQGDSFFVDYSTAYRIICIEPGVILETVDGDEDIQRVIAGDTQLIEGIN